MKISKEIKNCNTCIYRNLLYDKLNDAEYEQVNNARTEYVFKRGEIIRREGDTIDSFLYLRRGLLKLFKTDHLGKDHNFHWRTSLKICFQKLYISYS